MIVQHPEQFEHILMGDLGDEDEGESEGQQGHGGHGGQILITQEEEAAINRLAELGFSKLEAAQAYMACDKNE